MWPDRRLLERLGVVHPIVQAPMAGASTPELVAAVSNAGGLGSLGAAMMPPDAIRAAIRDIRRLTQRPFAVNLFTYTVPEPETDRVARMKARVEGYVRALGADPAKLPAMPPLPDIAQQLDVVLEEAPPVFSFTFGMPDKAYVDALRAKGIVVIGTATIVAEAKQLVALGVDAVTAQGSEAGGHRGTFAAPVDEALIGTLALVPMVVDAVEVPVIAAGGIMDGRGIAAASMLGAAAAALGTAFLTCPENKAVNPVYRAALLGGAGAPTAMTRAYTGRHARFIRNRFVAEMEGADADVPSYPHQIPLTAPLRALGLEKSDPGVLPMLAGQAYPLCRALPAGELVHTLVREAAALLVPARHQRS
jgi:nitronate monooxygenase